MSAVLHHKDLLLNDGEVITWFQFDYLNGGQLASGQTSSLQAITQLLIKIRGRGVSGSIWSIGHLWQLMVTNWLIGVS